MGGETSGKKRREEDAGKKLEGESAIPQEWDEGNRETPKRCMSWDDHIKWERRGLDNRDREANNKETT